jgi:HAD superfamily hydrolase (TIGR01509 family)
VSGRLTPRLLLKKQLVLFDMDGTLLNTEECHFKALIEVAGLPSDFDWHPFVGMPDSTVLELVFPEWSAQEISGTIERKNSCLLSLIDSLTEAKLESMLTPGVRMLLSYLNQQKIPCVLVSASEEVIVKAMMRSFKLEHHFAKLYPRESTARPKPSPSPYLQALRDYRVSSTEALIFEDSVTGIEAALQTGAQVVRVTTHLDELSLQKYRDLQSIDQFHWLIQNESDPE